MKIAIKGFKKKTKITVLKKTELLKNMRIIIRFGDEIILIIMTKREIIKMLMNPMLLLSNSSLIKKLK